MEQNIDRRSLYIKPLLECPECKKMTLEYTQEENGIRYRCLNPQCSYHAFKKDWGGGQAGKVFAVLVIVAIVAVFSMWW